MIWECNTIRQSQALEFDRVSRDASNLRESAQLKFLSFEQGFLVAAAQRLLATDPQSSLYITGSYQHSPDKVRLTSDIDVMVFSERLRHGDTMIDYLRFLNKSAQQFSHDFGKCPFFFTRVNTEDHFAFAAKQDIRKHYEDLIPCHFLYYSDHAEFRHLERAKLADRLMQSATLVRGNPGISSFAGDNGPIWPLEQSRWDLERAIAELVLNQGIISDEFLVAGFQGAVFNSLRWLADELPGADRSINDVLHKFDSTGELDLISKFEPLLVIRGDLRLINSYSVTQLIAGPIELLRAINNSEWE